MNRIKLFLIGIFVILSVSSCLDTYKDLNTDKELLGITDPRYIFTGAVENFNNNSRGHLMSKYSGVMQLMQYIVNYGGAQDGIYVNTSKATGVSPFTPYYSDYFNNVGLKLRYLVNTVIPSVDNPDMYKDVAAIANILETYEAWLMFDVNGAAPYTEAFQLQTQNLRTPRYDLYQQDLNGDALYKKFDDKIKANIAVLKASDATQANLGLNDYFYGGDVKKWIKFANTLRIKMAQRLEKRDKSFYSTVIADALADAGGIISNSDESCIYNHPNEYGDNTDDICVLTYQYCASRAFVNFLSAYDDPRLPLLVRRNGFGLGNNNSINNSLVKDSLALYFPDYATRFKQWTKRYIGMSANPDSAASSWSKDAYYSLAYKDKSNKDRTMSIRMNSQIESRYWVKNGGYVGVQITARDKEDDTYSIDSKKFSCFFPLITYSETCFMMAEIAFKAGAAQGGKTASQWFTEGVRASMKQYQAWAAKMYVPSAMNEQSENYNPITDAKIDAYLARPEFQSVTLEKIISQQWVNLFMRPEEMWATWKRTGLPAFKAQPDPVGGVAFLEKITKSGVDMIIPRRAALPVPNSLNMDNYNAALKLLIQDSNYGASVNNTEGRIWWDIP